LFTLYSPNETLLKCFDLLTTNNGDCTTKHRGKKRPRHTGGTLFTVEMSGNNLANYTQEKETSRDRVLHNKIHLFWGGGYSLRDDLYPKILITHSFLLLT